MRILLVGNYPPDGQESMKRYADFLLRELLSIGSEVELVSPQPVLGGLAPRSRSLAKWLGYLDKFVLFPRKLKKISRGFDIVHVCDHSNAFYLNKLKVRAGVVTCHDLFAIKGAQGHYPEDRFKVSSRFRKRMEWTLAALESARFIVCVSQKTKDDLIGLIGHDRSGIYVIPLSLNWNYAPLDREQVDATILEVSPNIRERYLLHVGGNQWYKNRLGAMAIYARLRQYPGFESLQLVLAGKPWTKEMREFASANRLTDAIEAVKPSNRQIQALYSGAAGLLFPSFQEGFGWPILEAQACGCPVITSDRAPMTEVAGDGALFVDPTDPEAAALRVAAEFDRLPLLKEIGFANLERFALPRVIEQYCRAYGEMLGGK